MRLWRPGVLLFLASLVLAYLLFTNEFFHGFLLYLNGFGYLGVFLSGILFVSTFTVAPSVVILLEFAEVLNPVGIALVAGVGAALGDLLIFRVVRGWLARHRIVEEVEPILGKILERYAVHIRGIRYLSWTLPLVGAFIIASPAPDEVGIGMLGLSRIKAWQLVVLTFLLNAVGIFLLIEAYLAAVT